MTGHRLDQRAVKASPRWRRRSARPLAWLAILSLLSLLFMPMAGPAHAAAGVAHPCSAGHHQHHPSGSPKSPAGQAQHQGCPFCVAHAGFSPPPPIAPTLVPVAGFDVALAGTLSQAAVPALVFLTSLRSRAPPSSPPL